MASRLNGLAQPGSAMESANPMVAQARVGAEDAMKFQLWVGEQAQTLGRLKIFHTMAKSINDQQ